MRKSLWTLFLALALTACVQTVPEPSFRPDPSSSAGSGSFETDLGHEATPQTTDSLEIQTQTAATLKTTVLPDAILMGNEDTKRLMIIDDYGCTYCREFGLTDLPWVESVYAAQGKLALERVFLPMSPLGTFSAAVAICSAEQNAFAATDRALREKPIGTDTELQAFAKRVGLDIKKLRVCMKSEATTALLSAMESRAERDGVVRVPAFSIGEMRWLGVATRDELKKILDAATR